MSDSECDDLDISWIQEHEKEMNIDKNYLREHISEINVCFIYVNLNGYIEKIVCDVLEPDITQNDSVGLSRERVLHIIQNNKCMNNINYKLDDILLYCVDLECENLQNYSKNENFHEISKSFFKICPIFDPIIMPDSIFIFHSINNVYFLFKEIERKIPIMPTGILKKNANQNDKTKKNLDTNHHKQNYTKKVSFHDNVPALSNITISNKSSSRRNIKNKGSHNKTKKYYI